MTKAKGKAHVNLERKVQVGVSKGVSKGFWKAPVVVKKTKRNGYFVEDVQFSMSSKEPRCKGRCKGGAIILLHTDVHVLF